MEEKENSDHNYSAKRSVTKNNPITSTKKKTITILGDSITKEIKSQKLRQKMSNKDDKIFVKSFPGATTSQMKHYVKPSLEYEPNIIILHCGTNDLRNQKEPNEIASDILKLGQSIKNEGNEIIISSLTTRSDKYREKANSVNKKLKALCKKNSVEFIDNSNIIESHLSRDGLHLYFKGTVALGQNFINAITA